MLGVDALAEHAGDSWTNDTIENTQMGKYTSTVLTLVCFHVLTGLLSFLSPFGELSDGKSRSKTNVLEQITKWETCTSSVLTIVCVLLCFILSREWESWRKFTKWKLHIWGVGFHLFRFVFVIVVRVYVIWKYIQPDGKVNQTWQNGKIDQMEKLHVDNVGRSLCSIVLLIGLFMQVGEIDNKKQTGPNFTNWKNKPHGRNARLRCWTSLVLMCVSILLHMLTLFNCIVDRTGMLTKLNKIQKLTKWTNCT